MLLKEYSPRSELVVPSTPLPGPAFPVIDFHGHFGPLYSEVWRSEGIKSRNGIGLCVAEFKALGIERIVNLDGFFEGFRGFRMDDFWEVMDSHPDFFIPFVSVDTGRVDEADFEQSVRRHLETAVARGARGIKLFKVVTLSRLAADGSFKPGRGLMLDDPRLKVIWATAAEFGIPVLAHIGDPRAFFRPVDRFNERYEELIQHPDWQFYGPDQYRFEELLEMQDRLLEDNRTTTFVIPHGGSYPENLGWVDAALGRHPNMMIDIAERINEFGRAPYSARKFFIKHQDRILFGSDAFPDNMGRRYPPYFRFLETWDEYFDPGPWNARWKIYGIGLPSEVLHKIYRGNAERILAQARIPSGQAGTGKTAD
jgi:predicted TIM-barrel fold metal-dependent hydrolase